VSEAIRRPEGGEVTMNFEASAKTIDPVCGIEVIPFQSAGKSEYEGRTHYFCSPVCKQLFEQNLEHYTDEG
jgi:Cu+-exporting ATPase